ncbi:hypothetical protein PAXINDRAFT_176697 [Paxillus involutus ATCC 200175]|uniref:Uncharacterized protein n=1 Tax=Paxillus involutus ATCC 200175 TaxID=664439 RepID=A0A0C9TW74_PAXIN|nr:hypothetical protein PAXINDRAFT_176697 [Paxillus involutus ATCC 200175]
MPTMKRPETADTSITLVSNQDILPPPAVQSRRSRNSSASTATFVNVKDFLFEEIDPERAIPPLSAYCFMTGFINAVCFSAIFAWCASQTGNTIQLSVAVGRLLDDPNADSSFHLSDRLAVCSLITFIAGCYVGRFGDRIGYKTRLWMCAGTFLQALLTMGAAITSWQSGAPTFAAANSGAVWKTPLSFACLGFMSSSMGLQGVMAKRLNTQFSTTVVLTSIWVELISEPKLFHLRRLVVERDHKIMTIAACFAGGFAGRTVLDEVGAPVTLGIAGGLRMLISILWLSSAKR